MIDAICFGRNFKHTSEQKTKCVGMLFELQPASFFKKRNQFFAVVSAGGEFFQCADHRARIVYRDSLFTFWCGTVGVARVCSVAFWCRWWRSRRRSAAN